MRRTKYVDFLLKSKLNNALTIFILCMIHFVIFCLFWRDILSNLFESTLMFHQAFVSDSYEDSFSWLSLVDACLFSELIINLFVDFRMEVSSVAPDDYLEKWTSILYVSSNIELSKDFSGSKLLLDFSCFIRLIDSLISFDNWCRVSISCSLPLEFFFCSVMSLKNVKFSGKFFYFSLVQ